MTSPIARAAGVIRSPRRTMALVVASPDWAGVLLLATVVIFVSSAALLSTETGRLALVDQWERTALAFGGTVDDARYARFEELSAHGIGYAALTAIMTGPVLATGMAILLSFVLNVTLREKTRFAVTLAIASYASVALALRQLIAAPLNYAYETLASPTTLIHVLPALDEANPLARFLGVIDVFIVWWILLLALGVASTGRRQVRPLALAFAGAYVAMAVLLAIAMALTGGTA